MASNLPPGVSENDYHIGGAAAEWEAEATCPLCDATALMPHEYHPSFGTWAWCPTGSCPNSKTGFEVPEPEPDYDSAHDERELR